MDILNEFLKEIESELVDGMDVYEKLLMIDCDKNLMEYQAELAAFSIPFSYLIEDSDFSMTRYEYEYNQILANSFFHDFLIYWQTRQKQTENPILKFTYAKLLWEFRDDLKGIMIEDVMKDIVSAAIEISKVNNSVMNLHQVMTYLSNALYIALCTKKDKLIRDVVDQVMVYCGRTDLINHNCVWFPVFFRLLKNRRRLSLSDLEINQIVEFLKSLMSVLFYPQDIIRIAEVLAAYYEQNKDRETVCKILDLAYDCTGKTITSGIGMAGIYTHLHDLAQMYAHKDMMNRIIIKMNHIGQLINGEMHLCKFDHPQEAITSMEKWRDGIKENLPDLIKKHGFSNLFIYLLNVNTPDIEDLYMNRTCGPSIIEALGVCEYTVDEYGIPITSSLVDINETAKMIKWFISDCFRFELPNFVFLVQELFSQHPDSKKDILVLVERSTCFDTQTKFIVSKGISMFFGKEYLASIHLIVPQFEDILRKFVLALGGVVRKKNRNGGYDLINLDQVLSSDEIKRVLSDASILYFKSILSNRQGINLRNNLCHGLIKECNCRIAIVVLQLVIMLAVIDLDITPCGEKISKTEDGL